MADNSNTPTDAGNSANPNTTNRDAIAKIVLIGSIGGLFLLAAIIIYKTEKTEAVATNIFNALLPLFGTWVGTLLAYYFSKDNFEAASKSVRDMASKVSGTTEQLQRIPLKDKMRPIKDVDFYTIKKGEEDKCLLSKILDDKKFERIPMLDDAGHIVYLIYKASIHQFLSRLALGKITIANVTPANATLADAFANDAKLKEMSEKSFGFVPLSASLADAQREMERISKACPCNDICVPQNGNAEEPVLGWITDNTIAENLKA